MARKGLWNRLFGGGAPDPRKDEPTKPDDPARWHEEEHTPPDEIQGGQEAQEQAETTQGPASETETDRPGPMDEAQSTSPDEARYDANDGDEQAEATRPDERGGKQVDDEPDPADLDEVPEAEAEDPAPEPRSESETTLLQTAELKTDAVGRVYAQSLLELARDAGQADAVAQEVSDLLPLAEPGGDLDRLVTNPAISTGERSKIVANIFEGRVSDLLFRFLQVVAQKDRLGSLDTILAGYLLAVAEDAGVVEVEAYVATPMDDATVSRVAEQIGQSLGGKQVTLRQHVDESLIGGLKIKVGDRLIDASVASQLNQMKRNILTSR